MAGLFLMQIAYWPHQSYRNRPMGSWANHVLCHWLLQCTEQHVLNLVRLAAHMGFDVDDIRAGFANELDHLIRYVDISEVHVMRALLSSKDLQPQEDRRGFQALQKFTDLPNPVSTQFVQNNFDARVANLLQAGHQVAHEMNLGEVNFGIQADQVLRWRQKPIVAPGMNAIKTIGLPKKPWHLHDAQICTP